MAQQLGELQELLKQKYPTLSIVQSVSINQVITSHHD